MTGQDQLTGFIRSTFRSIWQLELLLHLKREGAYRSHEEIVAALRASDLIVSRGVEALSAAGLLVVDAEARAAYRPVSDADAGLVDAAQGL